MYPDPYDSQGPWSGEMTTDPPRCLICGAVRGTCPDGGEPPFGPPVDLPLEGESVPTGGPLRLYTVTLYGHPTVMQLNDSDAARYGSAAVPNF